MKIVCFTFGTFCGCGMFSWKKHKQVQNDLDSLNYLYYSCLLWIVSLHIALDALGIDFVLKVTTLELCFCWMICMSQLTTSSRFFMYFLSYIIVWNTGKAGLWMLGQEAWSAFSESGCLHSGRLKSECFGPWTPDTLALDASTLHLSSQGTLSILVTSIFFCLLFNIIEFLNIYNSLVYYAFVKNGYYNSNLLQLKLQFKFPSETTTWSWTQLFMKKSRNNWLGNHSNRR